MVLKQDEAVAALLSRKMQVDIISLVCAHKEKVCLLSLSRQCEFVLSFAQRLEAGVNYAGAVEGALKWTLSVCAFNTGEIGNEILSFNEPLAYVLELFSDQQQPLRSLICMVKLSQLKILAIIGRVTKLKRYIKMQQLLEGVFPSFNGG